MVDELPDGAPAGQVYAQAVRLVIADDGAGIDADVRATGLGLIGMRERVEGFNGRFSVVSGTGQGTTISVELPLTPAESAA